MKGTPGINRLAIVLLVLTFAGSVLAVRQIEAIRGPHATLDEMLYVRSSKTLKRMSLGYSGLLADIYWTRAVQYYGGQQHHENVRYDLLYPLLDITTDLDPKLLVAYEFGSVFLSQKPPTGAGEPDKAVALVEKGIRANPDYWRLYFTLGFIHFLDRKDPKAAQQAFQRGSEHPKALSWMKVMAATMAQRANDPTLAYEIWKRLDETTEDKMIKANAEDHMHAIDVDLIISELDRRIVEFLRRKGRLPVNWGEMMDAGLLGRVPIDPAGHPYKLMPDGTVQVEDPDSLPYITKGLPPGYKRSKKPGL